MRNKKGFTLVELSIVLIIIGLIIAAIIVAQNLIKAAEIRAVVSDFEKIQTAYNVFKDKYRALPGDMTTATTYISTATYNGVGNNQITWASVSNIDGTNVNRGAIAWEHLTLAEVYHGKYTNATPNSIVAVIGTNVPQSKIGRGGYYFHYTSTLLNHVGFGLANTDKCDAAVLLTTDAKSIDTKMDDGFPNSGIVRKTVGGANCAADTGSSTPYNLATTTVACDLTYRVD